MPEPYLISPGRRIDVASMRHGGRSMLLGLCARIEAVLHSRPVRSLRPTSGPPSRVHSGVAGRHRYAGAVPTAVRVGECFVGTAYISTSPDAFKLPQLWFRFKILARGLNCICVC